MMTRSTSPAYRPLAAVLWMLSAWAASLGASDQVTLLRTPGGGIQPQAATDGQGCVHVIWFAGDPKSGDLWYARRDPGAADFSKPIQVNSQPGSAIAMGSVRGAHLALGRGGRVHVAWMGAGNAEPKGPRGTAPTLYARLDAAGTAFEAQRNVVQIADGLDGGGSLAADGRGHVYIAWHAMAGAKDESGRGVYVARSSDDGATFARELPASDLSTGACGCCGMRAAAESGGRVFMLYRDRAAIGGTGRDMMLLSSPDGRDFTGIDLQPWKISACPMSTCSIAVAPGRTLLAWQTGDQVFFSAIPSTSLRPSAPTVAPGQTKDRKHPAIAGAKDGTTLLAWTEGTGWSRGGSLAWQVFDPAGKPVGGIGHADGVPTWGIPTVVYAGEVFSIIY